MVNIKMVARLANVSPTTASCVINGKPGVKPQTVERVLSAARELNYVPNALAQSFRNKKSNTILVSTCEALDDSGVFTQELVGTVLRSRELGYDVLIKTYPGHDTKYLDELFSTVAGKRADSMVLIGSGYDALIEKCLKRDIKVVLLSAYSLHPVSTVNIDSEKWSSRITEYLIDKGCRNLAYFTFFADDREETSRLNGFLHVMDRRGLKDHARTYVCGATSVKDLDDAIDAMLDQTPLDGVVCWNDAIACQVIDRLRLRGLRVPEDVAVTGFDDVYGELYQFHALTTVKQPFIEMGRKAVDILIATMNGEIDEPLDEKIECSLVIRQSA
jgi:LacI family repressor for deo operon, udp, cdd, tsx, nupC, and nupG